MPSSCTSTSTNDVKPTVTSSSFLGVNRQAPGRPRQEAGDLGMAEGFHTRVPPLLMLSLLLAELLMLLLPLPWLDRDASGAGLPPLPGPESLRLSLSQLGAASQHQRSEHLVSFLVWNAAGLSEVTAVLHETWAYIAQFDVIMLSETQTPATLHQRLPNHIVHTIPASTSGRRGEGLLLAVRQSLPFSVTHSVTNQENGVIWLTLRPSHTSRHTTTIGVSYIPPESSILAQQNGRSAQALSDFEGAVDVGKHARPHPVGWGLQCQGWQPP